MLHFSAKIELIGINPFVFVPEKILTEIFTKAGKTKGSIPVHGTINDKPYKQTLVRYSGAWRLYINMIMLKDSPKRIGETIAVGIAFDTSDRTIAPHPALVVALEQNTDAKKVFESLTPSRQKEIVRYIANLKTEESITKNIEKVLGHLKGQNKFAGRE